ncbi:MAG: hypothetical protein A3J48_02850 [Candidatus Doudnabacteria bacterium RIFCSPHIGHO2_02_FULL_46_11]|uniref:Ribulose-phosphate 3-epimerase n=1 Tax=Candidatus Doudnabacteria bacterium RIFCSPHIGHO2_02_FULL_46_11 TaxID=1817832 RepID=A0A1F5P591_9BACT|nr:MAG: hypothetical protein A3J48_02850 [Candidatus Doudnabacteria bacterium RIFCSPHIGHO2_02_FULL_46_11]
MPIIVPSILTSEIEDFTKKLGQIETFPDVSMIHVDFADNKFVPNWTIMPANVPALPIKYIFAGHLMCVSPKVYLEDLQRAGFEIVAFHFEALASSEEIVAIASEIKNRGMKPQLAVNPDTPIEDIIPFINYFDYIHIMTVHPGFYGGKYEPNGEERVKYLRSRNFYGTISVDGGIDKSRVKGLVAAGADHLVVGSAIFKLGIPTQNYLEIKQELG